MLGVLCDRRSIFESISFFRALIGPAHRQKAEATVFFALPQRGLRGGLVRGMVMTGTIVREERVPIPRVILNLATATRRSRARAIRALGVRHAAYVVNPTNRLNQLMVMEMLASSETTAGLVAPHEALRRGNAARCLEGRDDLVVIPECGASLNLVAGGVRDGRPTERALGRMPSRLITVEMPEFKMNRNRLLVLRAHLQRSGNGQWRLLEHARILKKGNERVIPGVPAAQAALAIAGCVGNFIPRLGICFVDLIFDRDGNPFFLHLGGWDPRLLESPGSLAKASRGMPVDFWDWDLMGGRRQIHGAFSSNLQAYVALLELGVA